MDYLAAADEVASWLTSVAVERDGGLTWPTSPEVSDQAIPGLGWGALGSVLFFTDAYRTTKNDEYLRTAERGARWMHDVLHANDPSLAPGLFTGAAGIAVVVNELYRATGDDRYHDDIVTTFERLRERAIEADGGVNWRETTEILWGTAGIGCALLTIGAEHVGDGAVELAVRAGDWLIGQAESTTDGLRWSVGEGVIREQPWASRLRFPNFAHGTAGIAFFLAQLASRSDEARFLDAGLEAARWVLSTCKTDGGTCHARHHDPSELDKEMELGPKRSPNDTSPLYTIGWCHGPPGLGWLFRELRVATGDQSWDEWVWRTARTVRGSGIPEQLEAGFWDNLGRCCGSAGVAEYFLDLHTWRNDPDDLAFARTMMDDVLQRAISDERGMRFSNVEFRRDPPLIPPQTDFFQGASGIGLTLLRLARHLNHDYSVIDWPHAPVPGGD